MSDGQHCVRVPRALFVVSIAVLAAVGAMVVVGALRTGIAWDETYHVDRLRHYLTMGWFLTGNNLERGAPGPWVHDTYVYGPVAMLLLHLVSIVAGSPSETVAATAHAYAVRHAGVAAIGFIGTGAALVSAALLLRSMRWGVVAGAMVAAIPAWAGHSMFNIKDTPVATGYTLFTLGLLILVTAIETGHRGRITLGLLCSLLGTVLAVGTRPGIWPGLASSALIFAILQAVRQRRWPRRLYINLAMLSVTLGMAGLVLLFIYPAAFSRPGVALLRSATASSRYRGGAQGNWAYFPAHMLTDVPLLIGLSSGVGVLVAIGRFWRHRFQWEVQDAQIVLVLVQAFWLPILAMVRESDLYNGLRQLLFILPALAILATYGIHAALARLEGPDRRVWRHAVTAVVSTGLAVAVLLQGQLFPYNYTYFNLVATMAGVEPESDYWRTSVRELAPTIPSGGRVVCSPYWLDNKAQRFNFDGSFDCASDPVGPLAPYNALRRPSTEVPLGPTEFWAVIERTPRVPDNCTVVSSVTRGMGLARVVMSYVARCSLPFAEVPTSGVRFDRSFASWAYLLSGWANAPYGGVRIRGGNAGIALRIPADWRGVDRVRITLVGQRLLGLRMTANGADLTPAVDGRKAIVDVALDDVAAPPGGDLVLALRREPGARETDVVLKALNLHRID